MNHKIRRIVSLCLFFIILLSSLHLLNKIFLPKYVAENSEWPTTSTCNQFYKMEKDTIDVLFLGSSVVVNSFSPQELYNTYGIRSYNLGSEQQSIFFSYYWLKEALRFQSPKAVILDIKFAYPYYKNYGPLNMSEPLMRKCMDWMHYSKVKREAITNICKLDPAQTFHSYIFTNQRFHSRWTELKKIDFDLKSAYNTDLKGFSMLSDLWEKGYSPFVSTDRSVLEPPLPVMSEYLDKTVSLCKENGIELILANVPGNYVNDGVHNYFVGYAKEHGAHFIDFCEESVFDKLGADFPLINPVQHANVLGAAIMTGYIGEYLSDLGIERAADPQYESTRESYDRAKTVHTHVLYGHYLPTIADLKEYLKRIQNDNYSLFISMTGDGESFEMGKEQQEWLHALGLQSDFSQSSRRSLCAVFDRGKLVYEEMSPVESKCMGTTEHGGLAYSIQSMESADGFTSTITIGATDYSKNQRGLHIVVYDHILEKVIDSVNFDIYADLSCKR